MNIIQKIFGKSRISLVDAMETVKKHVQEDEDYAWSWHCNLAMIAIDAGADRRRANEQAATAMKHLFDVDMREHKYYLQEAR